MTVHTLRAGQVNPFTRLQITTRSKPCIGKSTGCPRGIKRPSYSATSRGSLMKRRLGGSAAGSARSVRKSPARERLRRRLDRRGLAYPSGIVAAATESTKPSVLPNVLVGSTVKNVMSLSTGLAAGSVPASIASLSQGVLRSMLFAKIRLIFAALVGLGAAATGVSVGVDVVGRDSAAGTTTTTARAAAPGPNPEPIAVAAATPEPKAEEEPVRETESIVHSAMNLKRIAWAIHAFLRPTTKTSRPRRSSAQVARRS